MAGARGTSFKSYVLCSICKISHNCHIKHLYSPLHKRNVKSILKKSALKVSLAKSKGVTVEVHDEDWQKEEKFWCYFCSDEFQKHFAHNSVVVACFGLINHLVGQGHYDCVKKFLKSNRLKDSAEKYILKKTEHTSFLSHLQEAEAQYLKKMEYLHQKDVAHIQNVEKQRHELVEQMTLPLGCHVQASTSANTSQYQTQVLLNSHNQTVSTVAGSSNSTQQSRVHQQSWNGRNKVRLPSADVKIPPWLLPDDDDENPRPSTSVHAPVVGPTIDDLLKHVEKQRKKGLNPKRVGANFCHKALTSSSWLPSFGRVWNQGRRKQSQFQYERERKKR